MPLSSMATSGAPSSPVRAPAPTPVIPTLTKSEKKRKHSREWHSKWVKKGVPRVETASSSPLPVEAAAMAPVAVAKAGSDCHVEAPAEADSDRRIEAIGDLVHDAEAAGTARHMDPADIVAGPAKPAAPKRAQGELKVAMDKFVKAWVASSGMPKCLERRTAAFAAWMSSSERASLLATRAAMMP
jgi:hypothetical protein